MKHAAVYACGDLLLMAAGFVLVPLYARWLTPGEFGALEMLDRVSEVAAICLLGRTLPMVAFTFFKQGRDDRERQCALSAAFVLAVGALVVGAGVLAVSAGPVAHLLHLDAPLLLWCAILAALLECLTGVAMAANQARLESGSFVLTAFAQFVFRVVLCLVLVVVLDWGVWGIVLASLLRGGVFGIWMIVREWRHGLAWPARETFRDMLRFALPFLPSGLCFFLLNSGDRFFLVRWHGQEAVGIYGIAYKVALLVGLFSMTPLYRVWSARMYDAAATPDGPAVFGTMIARILSVYVLVGLVLCLFQQEVIGLFAGPTFAEAATVLAPLVLAYWFFSASTLLEGGFYVRRQTRWKPLIALFSAAAMLTCYLLLIPRYGPMGAALATLIGLAIHAVATWAVSQRVFWVRHEYGRAFGILGLAVICWLLSRTVPSGAVGVLLKATLLVVWLAALVATGLVRADEVALLKELGSALAAWRPGGRKEEPVGA